MIAIPLALALLSAQSADFYMDEKPAQQESRIADVRAGGGGAAIRAVDGVGMAAEAGLELQPWHVASVPVALRLTVGSNIKVGWGTFFFAPEAVFRLRDVHSTWSPYAAVGANLALLNISDQALGIDRIPTWRQALGGMGAAEGNPRPDGLGEAPGALAVKGSIGPQASIGVRWQAFKRVGLDLAGRWTMLQFKGDTYQNFAAVLTVCAPSF
jgi:hypothetical protein